MWVDFYGFFSGRRHYHPAQELGVLLTLIHRANYILNEANLHTELVHLRRTFRKNGYSTRHIHRELQLTGRLSETGNKQKPISTALLPHVYNLSNPVARH
jgi:hypothetical protein